MEKLTCNIFAPFTSWSNYGEKGRRFTHDLLKIYKDWNINLVNYVTDHTRDGYIDLDLIPLINGGVESPDVCITIGYPTIFQEGGKVNIGVVDSCDVCNEEDEKLYIVHCNRMNALIVYSDYTKETLMNLELNYEGNILKITPPIYVITEYSSHADKFINATIGESPISYIKTDWNFLCEGEWRVNEPEFGGINRDNFGFIIRCFYEIFKDIEGAPGLVINARGSMSSTVDMDKINREINSIRESIDYKKSLPEVYLINGDLEEYQSYNLYNDPKIKAFIHIPQRIDDAHKDLNYVYTGKPIIYSNWGIQRVLLNYQGNYAINGSLRHISEKETSPVIVDANGGDLKLSMYEMYYHYDYFRDGALKNNAIALNLCTKEGSLNRLMVVIDDISKLKEDIKDQ